MALHDKNVRRWFATGIAGFSVVADSLSAIKYAKVKPIRDENGVTVDFEIEGDFPKYGNDDDRVDEIAKQVLHTFIGYVKGNHTYRGGIQTTSILTITSNVSYGKNTGATPDGRKKGVALDVIPMVRLHPWHLSLNFHLWIHRMVFPTHLPLYRMHWAKMRQHRRTILLQC